MSQHCRSWTDVEETVAANGVHKREMSGARVSLVQVVVPAGTTAPVHSHDFEQFVQVISGTGMLDTEQGRLAFGPGSVFHFPPGVEHAATFTTDTVLVETNLAG